MDAPFLREEYYTESYCLSCGQMRRSSKSGGNIIPNYLEKFIEIPRLLNKPRYNISFGITSMFYELLQVSLPQRIAPIKKVPS